MMTTFRQRFKWWISEHVIEVYVILILMAIAFGVNWMAYEQMKANSGIFINPVALSAQPPTSSTRNF